MRRIIIIGAGAVGGSIGGLLHGAGVPVVLVARGTHGEAIRTRGLHLRLPDRQLRVLASCVEHPQLVDWRSGDLALVATKLQDTRLVLDDLLAAAGPELPVVCAQNGIHGEVWAAERFQRVLSMLVWMPAVHLVPGEVWLHGHPCPGVLEVGLHPEGVDPLVEVLCAALTGAGFDSQPQPRIQAWKRAKWLTNLGNVVEALVDGDRQAVTRAATAEGEAVLRAAGLAVIPRSDLLARVKQVGSAPVDGEERPGGSTWQSLARGRDLETSHLNGALVTLGQQVGVPTPVNARLTEASQMRWRLEAEEVLAAR